MKIVQTGLLLFLFSASVFNQNWDLFVKDRNSYYKQQFGNSTKVENFTADSVLHSGSKTILFFNRKSELKNECQENLYHQYSYFDWLKNIDKVDSLVMVHDSVLYISDDFGAVDTFIFKPLTKQNDTWSTNGISITCSRIELMDISGVQDSVKIFTCNGNYENIEIVLSKTHGLIKFLPFREFLFHENLQVFVPVFELIGFSEGGVSKGYKRPDFSDYFHLHQGDKLYYRIFSEGWMEPDVINYRIDSITYSFISADSVFYGYRSSYSDESGINFHVGDYFDHYTRKQYDPIINNSTSWFGVMRGNIGPSETFFLEPLYFTITDLDTITYLRYQQQGVFIDTVNCSVGVMADFDQTVGLSTREGIIYWASFSGGEYSTTLIGSVINGSDNGQTNIPTATGNIPADKITIYPNPFNDYLHFKNFILTPFEIYDLSGNKVYSGICEDMVNLSSLNPGIYILKIYGNDHIQTFRIIKN